MLRIENERLRSQVSTQKIEIHVLRGERDSLRQAVTNLDIQLTQAEYQRLSQQQQQQPKKK